MGRFDERDGEGPRAHAGALAGLFALPGVDATEGLAAERIRVLRPPDLPGTEWIVALHSRHQFRVFHEDYELCVVPADLNAREDGGRYAYRRWRIECRPGAVYLLEPDTLHSTTHVSGTPSFYVIKLERSAISALATELGLGAEPHFRELSSAAPAVLNAIDALVRALAGRADPLALETVLLRAIRTTLTGTAEHPVVLPPPAWSPLLERAREYLHAHLRERVVLEDLVRVTGMGRYRLIRGFARAYGLPPHAYLVGIRLAEARRQLDTGIAPANVDAGFFDQAHLTRHFRRAYAVTPAAYQRALLS